MQRVVATCGCRRFALALLAAISTGCAQQSLPPDAVEAPQSTLAQQADAVRQGKASTVRVDQALVRDDDLQRLAGLAEQLRGINFSRTEISDAGLELLAEFDQLEQLRLSSSRVTDAGLRHVARLENLRFLHLLDTPISDAGLEHLHGLARLESLYLDRTGVTDAGLSRLMEAMPRVHLHIDEHHHPLDRHGRDHAH